MADARADRDDIEDLIVRYATAIDRKDWALFRRCFTPDCTTDYGRMGAWNDREALAVYMEDLHAPMSRTMHSMSNVAVDVVGDEAAGRTYVHAILVEAADSKRVWDAAGYYDDRFVRTPDGWRISDRTYVMVRWSPPPPAPAEPSTSTRG